MSEEPWLVRITKAEFKENAKKNYPEMTDDQWDGFVSEVDDGYDYSRLFDDLFGYLDNYMERQKEECPEPDVTHRMCDKFIPTLLDTNEKPEDRLIMLRNGVGGVCYEGGYSQIHDPDIKVCDHEDGWCTGYKKSEPFATNDMVMPTSDEVIKSSDYKELARHLTENYDPSLYQVQTAIWERKPEYCELHRVLHMYDKKTLEKVDVTRWAFIKSHMTGGIQSV